MLLTRAPLSPRASPRFPCDLHVLSMPPAFVLSQDQTLQFKSFGCSSIDRSAKTGRVELAYSRSFATRTRASSRRFRMLCLEPSPYKLSSYLVFREPNQRRRIGLTFYPFEDRVAVRFGVRFVVGCGRILRIFAEMSSLGVRAARTFPCHLVTVCFRPHVAAITAVLARCRKRSLGRSL